MKSRKASMMRLNRIEPMASDTAILGASTAVTELILVITSGKDVTIARNITPNKALDKKPFSVISWP